MNRFAKIASATALAALAFGSASYAAMNSPVDDALRSAANPKFSVTEIGWLGHSDPDRAEYGSLTPASSEVRDLQAAIRANGMLTKELAAQNVQVDNIVAAERAADGSFTFYLR